MLLPVSSSLQSLQRLFSSEVDPEGERAGVSRQPGDDEAERCPEHGNDVCRNIFLCER